MELLELALKQSIDWSVNSKGAAVGEGKRRLSYDNLELLKNKLRDESHARAFISHFKIELNNLMGLKWSLLNGVSPFSAADHTKEGDELDEDVDENEDEDTTPSEKAVDLCETAENLQRQHRLQMTRRQSSIQRATDLYDICEQQTDIDEDESDSRSSKRNADSSKSVASSTEDTDCGYGSLSRGENWEIAQELNEIKTRLIDLVEEINVQFSAHMDSDELDYYQRRREALVCKLDGLIERLASWRSASQQLSRATPGSKAQKTSKSERNSPSEYEEQVHVINLLL